jgi:hypothetical protein
MSDQQRAVERDERLKHIDPKLLRDMVLDAQTRTRVVDERALPYSPEHPVWLTLHHADGEPSEHRVQPLDLTSRGMGCLSSTFLHPETPVDARLALPDGAHLNVRGRIASCAYFRSLVHLTSVAFHEAIDPLSVVSGAEGGAVALPFTHATDRTLAHFAGAPMEEIDTYHGDDRMALIESLAWALQGTAGTLLPEEIRSHHRIAVVDADSGAILGVNPAWIRFGLENGITGVPFVGQNYLAALEPSKSTCGLIGSLLEGIERVRTGDAPEHRYLYDCAAPSASEPEWFAVRHASARRLGRDCIIVRHMPLQTPKGGLDGLSIVCDAA